jgi:hypothetical protein
METNGINNTFQEQGQFNPQPQPQPQGQMPPFVQPHLKIDQTGANILFPMMKKLKFVTIVAIVLICLFIVFSIFGLFGSMVFSRHFGYGGGGGAVAIGAIIYIAIFALVLYILTKQLSGINKTQRALQNMDNQSLVEGMSNFSTVVTFSYVMTIIYLALIALGIIAAIIGALAVH